MILLDAFSIGLNKILDNCSFYIYPLGKYLNPFLNFSFINYKNLVIGDISLQDIKDIVTLKSTFLGSDFNLENILRNGSFIFLFFALISFWIQFAFYFSTDPDLKKAKAMSSMSEGYPVNLPIESSPPPDTGSINKPFSFFLFKGIVPLRGARAKPPATLSQAKEPQIGNFLMLLANFSLILLLLLRWKNSGHFPLSNLYESLMFLSWSCTMLHFILLKMFTYQLPATNNEKELQQKIIGSITTPCALLLNAYATFSLPNEMQQVAPLVPALQSNWLMMHVTVMILSYAALILGSLFSVVYLILSAPFLNFKETFLKKQALLEQLIVSPESTQNKDYLAKLDIKELSYVKTLEVIPENNPNSSTKTRKGLFLTNIVENLENYSYRLIGIGFAFLTIGILSGAVWANEAWGSYWSWDPKETWAFLTWLVYAIYLHTRITKGWEGQKPAILASVGFISVWICFLGVNLIGEGLHSYGWFVKAV